MERRIIRTEFTISTTARPGYSEEDQRFDLLARQEILIEKVEPEFYKDPERSLGTRSSNSMEFRMARVKLRLLQHLVQAVSNCEIQPGVLTLGVFPPDEVKDFLSDS